MKTELINLFNVQNDIAENEHDPIVETLRIDVTGSLKMRKRWEALSDEKRGRLKININEFADHIVKVICDFDTLSLIECVATDRNGNKINSISNQEQPS